jgi:hypothetical protein
LCLGYMQKIPQKISKHQHDMIEKVVDKPNIKLYLGVGQYRWTRRIDRLGMIPLANWGKAIILINPNFDASDRDGDESSKKDSSFDDDMQATTGVSSSSLSSDKLNSSSSSNENSDSKDIANPAKKKIYFQEVKLLRDLQTHEAKLKEAISKTFEKVLSYEGMEKAVLLGFRSTQNALTKLYHKISEGAKPSNPN